ncbi:MAG: hypothetical protein QF808_01295 [Thalassolituus sp.]|jgi:hypothetical protein|uniref:hypothetical protein n=1 Tax=unclassified Thalassolituus TaxID=2624967 RepID=UPI000C0E94BC|nr:MULTISPECIES: hypothetical protein [unclassified Thalassolituus]MBN59686.1 hypothetical protein [Oceanospirillaceae bacterium]MDQ4422521.1 hypothetical protein [Thalassolituus sp.]MDQ4427330.1 hypothetical protein [Thalassolituus sp.]|tara:strand:+ start:255 stop:497 length:243 start_codon:yes stop_codon:yes gene_type:complete
MENSGVIYLMMLPAMALTMLHLGIGPFGHPSMIKHHLAFLRVPKLLRIIIQVICIAVLVTGAAQMLGIIDLTTSADNPAD